MNPECRVGRLFFPLLQFLFYFHGVAGAQQDPPAHGRQEIVRFFLLGQHCVQRLQAGAVIARLEQRHDFHDLQAFHAGLTNFELRDFLQRDGWRAQSHGVFRAPQAHQVRQLRRNGRFAELHFLELLGGLRGFVVVFFVELQQLIAPRQCVRVRRRNRIQPAPPVVHVLGQRVPV